MPRVTVPDDSPEPAIELPATDAPPNGGVMGRLIRQKDWSATPLGPLQAWPQSLRTAVGICTESRYPMAIWWGHGIVQLYNDGYIPVLGAKHPHALGQQRPRVLGRNLGTGRPVLHPGHGAG